MRAKHIRRVFTFVILLIAFSAGLYSQRVDVIEWYRGVSAPVLPEAVGYEEIVQPVEEQMDEKIEVLPNEEEPTDVEEPVIEEEPEEPAEEVVDDTPVVEEEPGVEEEVVFPASLNLAVPFTSQAPHGNWDEPYQEACEEASVYMVHAYFEGVPEGRIPADTADLDLLKIVAFEEELFGYYEDTTAEKTGVFAELMFGHTYRLIEDPTVDQIKAELVAGRPVIVPAAGRLLGNPYFTAPGPIYHMLVIRGYTQDDQFIVNDPGTSRGESFLYDFDTLLYALHDWNNGGEINQGRKVVIVLKIGRAHV